MLPEVRSMILYLLVRERSLRDRLKSQEKRRLSA